MTRKKKANRCQHIYRTLEEKDKKIKSLQEEKFILEKHNTDLKIRMEELEKFREKMGIHFHDEELDADDIAYCENEFQQFKNLIVQPLELNFLTLPKSHGKKYKNVKLSVPPNFNLNEVLDGWYKQYLGPKQHEYAFLFCGDLAATYISTVIDLKKIVDRWEIKFEGKNIIKCICKSLPYYRTLQMPEIFSPYLPIWQL